MKLFEYILKYTFVLGVTFFMGAVLGPKLIKKAISSIEKTTKSVEMQRIEISYLNKNTTRYITAKFTFNNNTYKKVYFTPDYEHKMIESFLCKNQFIESKSTVCKLNKSNIPLVLTNKQLSKLPAAKVIIDKTNDLNYLQFNEDVIIGKSTGLVGKILLFAIGILFSVFGVLLFVATTIFTFGNIKIYQQTGKLPHLPNTIDEMIKGFKFLIGKKD